MVVVGIGIFAFVCFAFTVKQAAKATAMIKILINFLQIMVNYVALAVEWPSVFTSFLKSLNFINLDVISLTPPTCVVDYRTNYSYALFVGIFQPVVIFLVVQLVYMSIATYGNIRKRDETDDDKAKRLGHWKGQRNRSFLWLITLAYPALSLKFIRIYKCTRVGDTDYLDVDLQVSRTA